MKESRENNTGHKIENQISSDKKAEILIVDDREENLLALEVMLARENYKLVRALSGREALKVLLGDHDFAIILMDVQMPMMNGFETAETIRQSEKFRNIPIIFLTASTGTEEEIFKGYKTGAVDFMVKPLSAQILKAKVSVFVDLFRKNRELSARGEYMRSLNDKLEQQSRYVRRIVEASLDPLITINSEGRITDVNEALEKITQLRRDEIEGTFFFDYFTNPRKAHEIVQEVFERGSIQDYLLTLRNREGKLTDVLFNGSVYRNDKGEVLGAVVVARERTISKYSRTLIEASLDPLITINPDGKITDMNQALSAITGLSREEIIGTDFLEYFTDREKARSVYQEAFSKGYVVDQPLVIRNREGHLRDVLFNGSVYKDERGNEQGIVIVARDITARKKFEDELIEAKRNAEKAKQVAEEAVKAKQQFLANMSHEIRTPMNAIVGFTKVVLKTDLTDKQKEYINAIKISGDALIVLINDILDLAKVDSGKMTFESIPFKLSASVYAMLHLFETRIKEKNLELVKEYDPSIPDVLVGDPVRLHQVILNLVSNAIKFTDKGKITVTVKLLNQTDKRATLEFSVSDTGIGIPEDKLDTIFENFQQASSSTSRLYGGTGLGLAIARQLITAQGGQLAVKSKPGKGSTFSFTLSFRKTGQKATSELEEREQLMNTNGKAKILVVEDVALNQLLMKTLLNEFGFELEVAGNGQLAIEKLEKEKFDLILMDLQMPVMNGFTATEHIRKKMHITIPIIALTADVTTVDLEKCRALGMNDYISKPIDEKLLLKKINTHLHTYKKTMTKMNGTTHKDKNPPETKNSRITNLEFLKQLTKNNHDMISEMVRVYLEETPQLITKMKDSLRNRDWESLRAAAHSILPSFATMGINDEYANKARTIQEKAEEQRDKPSDAEKKSGVISETGALISQIESVCEKAYKELQQEVAAL